MINENNDITRILELMSFDRSKTLYEMEQKWDNLLNEEAAPGGLSGEWDPSTKTYTIAKGDYLSKIAKAFGVDWKKMYEDNKSSLKSGDPDLVYAGEKVIINDYGDSSNQSSDATTDSTTVTQGATSYDPNALLYFAIEKRKLAIESQNMADAEKYGNLIEYYNELRTNPNAKPKNADDVKKFEEEFKNHVGTDQNTINHYTEMGKKTTVTKTQTGFDIKTQGADVTNTNTSDSSTEGNQTVLGGENKTETGQDDPNKYTRYTYQPLDKSDAASAFNQAFQQ